jgi:hypothetical protein
MKNDELNANEEPLLNPGLIQTNENTESSETDPELIDELLNRNEGNEEPMLPTGIKPE